MRDARYDIGDVIGRGGCATVYEAFDRLAMRHVALKVLDDPDPIALKRLEREARSVRAISHPNVCPMLDQGRLDDGQAYVAMELLHGETLRSYLKERGQLEPDEAIEIAVQMLAGLEAAHALGVVHRDVKPENVFLEWQDTGHVCVKLLDFGICRRVGDRLDEKTLTLTGCVVGTPGYFAPEQAFGERGVDPRTDLFSVGLVLYEAITGSPAFGNTDTTQLAVQLTRRLPSIRSLTSRALDRVIAMATEPNARSRYACAAKFQHELLEARTSLRRENMQRSGTVRVPGAPRRHVA